MTALVVVTTLVVATTCGCGDSQIVADGAGIPDQQIERIQPPDINVHDGTPQGNIGAPCDPDQGGNGCTGDAICLQVAKGDSCDLSTGAGCGGVCSIAGCTLENIKTPETEDDCPKGTACTQIPVATGGIKTFCLDECKPQVGKNPCKSKHAGLTCHPASVILNDHTEVCIYPACAQDSDCGNKDAINPDSLCLDKSGMCLSRGDPKGKIGAPCQTSTDCGPYQYCLLQQTEGGTTVFEGGYCTLVGCKYHEQFYDPKSPGENPYWQCPPESECFYVGSGEFTTFCLAVNCDPSKPDDKDGCRDMASPGQYDCIELGKEKACWLDIQSTGGK